MTVKRLKELIQSLPDDTEVLLGIEREVRHGGRYYPEKHCAPLSGIEEYDLFIVLTGEEE